MTEDVAEMLEAAAKDTAEGIERFADALVAISYTTEESKRAMERVMRRLARRPWTIRQYRRRGKGKNR